jgi:ferric-dicitrate binding protein FerR (iron transport regulator)
MYTNDDYILLLSKQFSGDLSPTESAALQKWLAQSPDNERLAAELRQVWEKTGGYGKAFSPNMDAAFRQVQMKIQTAEQPRAKIVPIGQRLMRVAAALLFLLAAVWGYRQISTPNVTKVFAQNEEKRLVELPDGSRVWLRQHGELEFPAQFINAERHVKLTGEAYFEVAPDAAHPFFVDLPNGDAVKVLGTEFGVRLLSNQTDVFVRSGKVFFSPKMQPKGVVLTAHQKATYDRQATQLTVDESATLNELAWQTGGLEFESTPMADVIADLEAHYNVKITLRNPAMRTCPHTALHTTQPIDKVLESLALTHQFRVGNPAPGQYELLGGNCQ